MLSPISTLIRRTTRRPGEIYNCLTFPTHERFQSNLANTNCNYWMIQGTPGVKGNGWIEKYAPIPYNHHLLNNINGNPFAELPPHINFDFALGQHRFGQAQTALQIGQQLGIPTIILEHTSVTNDNLRAAVPQLKQLRGDVNVFISESSCAAWDWSLEDPSVEIIHHGVDTEMFKPAGGTKENYVLSIVNDWVNRGDILGWDIFQRVVGNNKLPCKILGDNPGISQVPPSVYHLVQEYNRASVFYNTSRFSPIPSTLLEAMSCGLPVVTTDNFLISDVVVNGVNGYKTNSEAEQLRHLQRLLNDPAERQELGRNARQTIIDNFPLQEFTRRWNNVFGRVARINK